MEEWDSGGIDDMPLQILLLADTPALLCANGTPSIQVLMDQCTMHRLGFPQYPYSTRTVPVTVPVKNVRENNSSR